MLRLSISFGPASLTDISLSKILPGSTIVLHDIDGEKLEMIYDLVLAENDKIGNKYSIERTTDRAKAFRDADFIISSIEVGDRFKLWMQDYEIPRKHGSTQILGECGGPGGSFHAFRIIPPLLNIVRDAEKICPNAFFINFSNPMSRNCLAISRIVKDLKWCGLCHQIGFMDRHIPFILHDGLNENKLKELEGTSKKFSYIKEEHKKAWEYLRMKTAGLNHFAFLIGVENINTGEDLMPLFHKRAMNYFKDQEDRFEFSTLTFEVYKRFGMFPYVGDNHLGEYLQFGEDFTETQDMIDWINRADQGGKAIYDRVTRFHKRLKKGRYPRKGLLPNNPTGERAIPIIEAIIQDHNSYESAVNIPNKGIVDNLPRDLVIECSATVNKDGVHGVKVGSLPKQVAALLRIEASVQDVVVEAIIKQSKELAITALAIDPNVGSFEKAEAMFKEMRELQPEFLSYFK
ncbi:MAG: family 4 glycosyl hydrolase [Promethearchaeota archaeon]